MTFTQKITGIFALMVTGFLGTANSAQAQSYHHIDLMALQLQKQTEWMHREVDTHFRVSNLYKHLHHDVEEMEKLAAHIHEVAHNRGSIQHLRHDVERLDKLFHHIEELIEQARVYRHIDWHTYTHFRQAMGSINNTLHHLRDDLRFMDYHDPHHYLPSGGHGGHSHGGVMSGYSPAGGAIRVGNSKFGVTFQFGR